MRASSSRAPCTRTIRSDPFGALLKMAIHYGHTKPVEVDIADARNRLTQLVRAVEEGESIVITRNGKPVAQLVPAAVQAALRCALEACGTALSSCPDGTPRWISIAFLRAKSERLPGSARPSMLPRSIAPRPRLRSFFLLAVARSRRRPAGRENLPNRRFLQSREALEYQSARNSCSRGVSPRLPRGKQSPPEASDAPLSAFNPRSSTAILS